MERITSVWHYLLGEPFTWLFYCLFQPSRFARDIHDHYFFLKSRFRLILPLFLFSYPLALLIQGALYGVFPLPLPSLPNLFLMTAIGSIAGATFALTGDMNIGITGGIAGGIVFGITGGTTVTISIASALFLVEAMFFLATFRAFASQDLIFFALGILLCIVMSIIDVSQGRQADITSGIAVGIVVTLVMMVIRSLVILLLGSIRYILSGGDKARVEMARRTIIAGCASLLVTGILILILTGVALINLSNHLFRLHPIAQAMISSIMTSVMLATGALSGLMIGIGVVLLLLGGLRYIISGGESGKVGAAKTTTVYGCASFIVFGSIEAVLIAGLIIHPFDLRLTGIVPGSVFSGLIGGGIEGALGSMLAAGLGGIISRTTRGSNTNSVIIAGLGHGFVWGLFWGILWGNTGNMLWGIIGGSLLLPGSLLVFYRLPLYPLSAFSMLNTASASRSTPEEVFIYLHHSSLYWDECVFLPLPGLRQTLCIAIQQNIQQTLEEIDFIAAERPQQIHTARLALLEIAVQDLERRHTLRDIAEASERLFELFPQGTDLVHPQWKLFFTQLSDASRDAARACSPLGWQAKREALEEMLTGLNRIHANITRERELNHRLAKIFTSWRILASQELEELDHASEKTSRISNPYSPGSVLQSRDRLFVGRDDLVRRLEESLNRGENRPTFLLHGERRMGKSSVLKQLSAHLGNRYLSIYYDLTRPGISSSTTALLQYIAEGIYQEIKFRGIEIRRLEYKRLKNASRENEAAIYLPFEEWLEQVENVLKMKNRILLLTFDEFEKLEDAGQNGYIQLDLLLSWFRSVIQGYQHTALLFSGIQTFGEMGAQWARAFVNVQILKVSFLHRKEAVQLVTHPTRDFPSEHLFGSGVVDEILHVTGCHPFFIQGVCSELIEYLNEEERFHAEIDDVVIATNRFLDAWWHTHFRDLWERTDEMQRTCLFILHQLGKADLPTIEQHSDLSRRILRDTLEILHERDLLRLEHTSYYIATPIFDRWVERHM